MRREPNIDDLQRSMILELGQRLQKFEMELLDVWEDSPGSVPRVNYRYQLSPRKMQQFIRWVDQQIYAKVFRVLRGPPKLVHKGKWWANAYVESAYKRGMAHAIQDLAGSGAPQAGEMTRVVGETSGAALDVMFLSPIHMDRVALLYGRAFEGMKGIAGSLSSSLSSILAEGMASGRNPYDIAASIKRSLDITGGRARTIARTEIMRAHHVGAIQTYREAGVEGVRVLAELITVAGGKDHLYDPLHVCPKCQALERQTRRKPMSLDEVEPLIPVHPNCRCTVVPIVQPPEKKN